MENILLNSWDLERASAGLEDLKKDQNGLNDRRMDLFSISAYRPESENATESFPDFLFIGKDRERFTQGLEEFAGAQLTETGSLMKTFDLMKQMYFGTVQENGKNTLGLKDISEYKINKNYRESNIRQHAGYAAEVISTIQENANAIATGSEIRTYRTDDFPDTFGKNHPYVDKVRVDANGKILERVQTKFVGRDPAECLSRLRSSAFAKYIEDGFVDKIEIPKDFYGEVKRLLGESIAASEQKLVRNDFSDIEAALKCRSDFESKNKLYTMLEPSTVTTHQARFSVLHPKQLTASFFTKDSVKGTIAKIDNRLDSVKGDVIRTAFITGGVSLCSNMSEVMNGQKEFGDAVLDSGKEIALASGTQFAAGLIDNNVSVLMEKPSSQLFRTLGRCGIPSAVISTAATSLDSLVDLAQGEIGYMEFVDDLAKNGICAAGGAIGYAAVTAAVSGVSLPALGTAGLAIAGSMAASVLAGQVYKTCKDVLPEAAEACGKAMKDLGDQTVRYVSDTIPQAAGEIQNGLNEFFGSLNLNFTV